MVDGAEVDPASDSATIDLVEGENLIEIQVTAADGNATTTYTLTVFRGSDGTTPASSGADLSDLTLTGAALDQRFQPSQMAYSASVGYLQTSVSVTPVAADAGATIQVNDAQVTSGSASAAIELAEGLTRMFHPAALKVK